MDMINTSEITKQNAFTFEKEMTWLSYRIDQRLDLFFENTASEKKSITSPNLQEDSSNYASLIEKYKADEEERLIVAIALASYFKPEMFDRFLIKNKSLDQNFTEFGGKKDNSSGNTFIPTLRTVAFILFGDQISEYFRLQFYFEDQHFFKVHNIIILDKKNQLLLDSTLEIGQEFLQKVTNGKDFKPSYSSAFPANLITTDLDWSDLVLENHVFDEIDIIDTWLKNKNDISQNKLLSKKIPQNRKGFNINFYHSMNRKYNLVFSRHQETSLLK